MEKKKSNSSHPKSCEINLRFPQPDSMPSSVRCAYLVDVLDSLEIVFGVSELGFAMKQFLEKKLYR